MIFDTHAHYDDDAFDEDRDTLLGENFLLRQFVCITGRWCVREILKKCGCTFKKVAADIC